MENHPGLAPQGEPSTFEGCLARVNPSKESLRTLSLQKDHTPIIMLNLLRFRPRGDATIYSMYGKAAAPEVEKTGSFVGYFGKTLTGLSSTFGFDDSWDAVVMPVYKRRHAYLGLQESSAYQLAIPYRCAGTSRRSLYVMADDEEASGASHSIASMNASREPLANDDESVFVLELFQVKKEHTKPIDFFSARSKMISSVGARLELCLTPEIPVLSEEFWDQCLMTRYPNKGALEALYSNEKWQEHLSDQKMLCDAFLSVASGPLNVPV